MKSEHEIVEEMSQVVEQMRFDDLKIIRKLQTSFLIAIVAGKTNALPVQLNMKVIDCVMTVCFLLKQVLRLVK